MELTSSIALLVFPTYVDSLLLIVMDCLVETILNVHFSMYLWKDLMFMFLAWLRFSKVKGGSRS